MIKSEIPSMKENLLSNGHNSPECQTEEQDKSNLKKYETSEGDDLKKNKSTKSIEDRLKIFCRIRPFDGINKTFFKFTENTKEGVNHVVSINRSSIKDENLETLGGKFKFDYIFDEEFTQIEVFQETCMTLITELVEDRKSSIVLANGLNNSGKTYSVVGDIENPGILPLSLRFVFDQVKEKKSKMIELYCNYLEIDEDNVYDLLSDQEGERTKVRMPNRLGEYRQVKKFPLNTIQDCSNAINIGNKRKSMKKGHSLTSTYFQIIIRFFENNDKFEEASLVILDLAHQEGKEFTNLSKLNLGDTSFMNLPHDAYWQHLCLCKIVKGLQGMSYGKKYRHGRPTADYCDLTIILRNYLFSTFKIVLITNINPAVEHAEENLKVFHFSSMFKDGIKIVDDVLPVSDREIRIKKTLSKEREREYAWEKERQKKQDGIKKERENAKDNDIIIKKADKVELRNFNEKSLSPIKNIKDKIISNSPFKKDNHPSKIISLNEEEKNNLYNTLQKNQPKFDYRTYPQKSSTFHDWELSDVKKQPNFNFIKDKEEFSGKFSNSEIEKMKLDYENLKKKFEEQERLIKTILDKNASSKLDMNNGKLIPNQEDNSEISSDVQKILGNPDYKETLKILESNSHESVENKKSNIKPEGRLYNIILMNPSIQHFTILNKDSDGPFEKSQENKIIREIPKIEFVNEKKDTKEGIEKKIEVKSFNTNLLQSRYENEFIKENKYLLSIDKESTIEEISDNTSLKNRKDPILLPLQINKKKKRIRKSRAKPKK